MEQFSTPVLLIKRKKERNKKPRTHENQTTNKNKIGFTLGSLCRFSNYVNLNHTWKIKRSLRSAKQKRQRRDFLSPHEQGRAHAPLAASSPHPAQPGRPPEGRPCPLPREPGLGHGGRARCRRTVGWGAYLEGAGREKYGGKGRDEGITHPSAPGMPHLHQRGQFQHWEEEKGGKGGAGLATRSPTPGVVSSRAAEEILTA